MEPTKIPLQRLDASLPLPKYAYPGDAGVDLRSRTSIVLAPFERAAVPTGIAVAIPRGYAGLVLPRSGLALRSGISVVNAPGLIDSNFRGEIQAILVNLDPHEDFAIEPGDRIAQLMVVKVDDMAFREVDALDDTERGTAGFGSSGV